MSRGDKPNFAEGTQTGKAPEGDVLARRLKVVETINSSKNETKRIDDEEKKKQDNLGPVLSKRLKGVENAEWAAKIKAAREKVEDQPSMN